MHEFYESPIPTAPIDCYFVNTDLSRTNGWAESGTNGWEASSTANGWTVSKSNSANIYFCKIDEGDNRYKITVGNSYEDPSSRDLWPATDAIFHTKDTRCVVFTARWGNGSCAITQTTTKKLLKGTYRLKYDIQNANNDYTDHDHTYQNLFSVTVGGTEIKDNNTDWINSGNWSTHSIEFTVDGNQDVTISLGYGTTTDGPSQMHTPVLFVSNLYLETVSVERDPRITWNGNNIESISVVKDWTSKRPSQQPQTLYYSWLDHQYRFSMNHPEQWSIGRNNNPDYKINNSNGEAIYGIGLYNESQTAFKILNLKQGDQFCVEYYLDPNTSGASAYLANGNHEMTATVQERVTDQESGTNTITSSEYYTISSEGGCVQIMMPAKTILRSVTIIHKNYKKATYNITEVTDEDSNKGYKYTLTGAGVLEDKRGAVPYITMRFGADNDMTFVKKLGDGDNAEFGAVSIVDEKNDFNPTTARLQSTYQSLSEAEAKGRLAGKEWTVFSTDLDANGSDIFRSILPHYGTYYYFFPEVNGKLSLRFYCEGSYEHMPFWFKSKNGEIVDDLTRSMDTDGRYYYEYNDINVEKGGVYYLCSNPTIVQHELPIVRLISYEFIPTFHVEPLYDVIGNGSNGVSEIATIKGVTINEFTGMKSGDGYVLDNDAIITINGEDAPRVKFLGNIKDATISLTQQGDNIKLNFSNITYKDNVENVNQGGAIVVILDCPAGRATFVLTVAYDAAGKNPNGTAVSTQVKKWDFYSGVGDGTNGDWDLGKYGIVDDGDKILYETDKTAWEGRSKLFKEVNKADGLTADWVDTYVNLSDDNDERIFKSVYDMEGDNADMIHETAGLVFSTHANQLGIMNENNEPTAQFQDRYIGLMKGSKFTIPLLEAGDRIVLKMGTYNNENVTLGMTNAKDVSSTGNTIGNNYIIGGSVPVEGDVKDANGHVVPRGEYHIQAIANDDVDIEVIDGQLLKIYSIEIYRNAANNNADILTENKVKGTDENNTREILYTEADTNTKSIGLQLNYRGLNESTAPLNHVRMTGNIEQNDITVTSSGDTHTYSTPKPTKATGAQFENGKFGAFKTRIAVKTLQSGAYVTDYADCMVPVGFREKLDYPNTWDFTDLREKYVTVKENNVVTNGIDDATGNEKPVADGDLEIWKNWSLTAAPENFDGNLFVSGGQLYAGSKMFDETRGLGIVHNGSNDILSLTATTESGEGESREGAISISNVDSYGFIVPQVAAGQAVYVHATPISGQTQSAQFAIGEGSPQAFTYTNGDNIFAMKLPADATDSDVKLRFQGYEVNKIAVATDEKTVNDEGWNTESRARAIDPSLLPYMTGKDFRTYTASAISTKDDGEKIVTLTRIDGVSADDDESAAKYVVPAANNKDPYACIIRNAGGAAVDMFGAGSGFHLFVPDMHDAADKTAPIWSNNLLKARVTPTTGDDKVLRDEDGKANYAFTNKWKYVDADGKELEGRGGQKVGDQAFYRIMQGGASSDGNQAYLSIADNIYPARLSIVFEGEKGDSEATGIATVEDDSVGGENARFYNLSGQQLSGKPNRSGLYIVNGKKVSIKNK